MLSGVYRFPQMENVVFGRPFAEALAEEVGRIDARAVFVLASGTLARTRILWTGFGNSWATELRECAQKSAPIRRGPMSSRRQTRPAKPGPICLLPLVEAR